MRCRTEVIGRGMMPVRCDRCVSVASRFGNTGAWHLSEKCLEKCARKMPLTAFWQCARTLATVQMRNFRFKEALPTNCGLRENWTAASPDSFSRRLPHHCRFHNHQAPHPHPFAEFFTRSGNIPKAVGQFPKGCGQFPNPSGAMLNRRELFLAVGEVFSRAGKTSSTAAASSRIIGLLA